MPQKPKSAGILSTGTEILQGLYPDTNAQWLSTRLGAMGIESVRHVAAPDDPNDVADGLRYLSERCDVVIMSGGLGPTADDLTRDAVCEVFGSRLVEDAEAWQMIRRRFAHRDVLPPKSNRVQCMVPEDARVMQNEWGTAPGFVLEATLGPRPVWFAALPGPPGELQPMFEKHMAAELTQRFGAGRVLLTRVLHTYGVSESALNDRLGGLFSDLRGDANRRLAYLAKHARVDLRVTTQGRDGREARRRMGPLVARVRRRVPAGHIYGSDDETLESVVGRLLRKQGLRLATAESCTGGLVAKRLTDVAGSSEFLLEGWVTYTNEAKRKRLGVRKATLDRFGAVSSETAREMARGALERSGADMAVALTGIAGPGGGTPEKPVGTVWYGFAWRSALRDLATTRNLDPELDIREYGDTLVATCTSCLPSSREVVRSFSSHRALDLVRRLTLGLPLSIGVGERRPSDGGKP